MRSELPWERPLGAHPGPDGTTEFRVWAPRPESVALRIEGRELALEHAGHDVFEVTTQATAGEDYAFVVDGQELPDPCTRWQPAGLRGPSRVLDSVAASSGRTTASGAGRWPIRCCSSCTWARSPRRAPSTARSPICASWPRPGSPPSS